MSISRASDQVWTKNSTNPSRDYFNQARDWFTEPRKITDFHISLIEQMVNNAILFDYKRQHI
jgi:hypothetical protein